MPRVTPVPYSKFVKFLRYVGCEESRQKGSHVAFNREDLTRPVIVPKHKEVYVPVILSNLRTLKISPSKYLEILAGL